MSLFLCDHSVWCYLVWCRVLCKRWAWCRQI